MTHQPSTIFVSAAAALLAGPIVLAGIDDAFAGSHANVPGSCGAQCPAKPPAPTRSLTAPTGPARGTNPCPHKRGGGPPFGPNAKCL
jgi:hypothetical protein